MGRWEEGGEGGGSGGEPKAISSISTLKQKSSYCVLMKVLKGSQRTCQAKKAVGSSLTPSVALSVHLSGIVHPSVDYLGFIRSQRLSIPDTATYM